MKRIVTDKDISFIRNFKAGEKKNYSVYSGGIAPYDIYSVIIADDNIFEGI